MVIRREGGPEQGIDCVEDLNKESTAIKRGVLREMNEYETMIMERGICTEDCLLCSPCSNILAKETIDLNHDHFSRD